MSRRAQRQKPRDRARASGAATGWRGTESLPFAAPLFLSGAVALIYETLWVRQLGRVVGVEVHAVSIALSAFFGGLALGSVLFGRLADRVLRPFRLYAGLEAGVAVLGLLSTLALARSAPLFVVLEETVGPLAWALPFGLVGLPAVLMGGTLPALLRAYPVADAVAPATGLLYAVNTAGAVVGTLATPFLLIPAFGIQGTGWFAAAMGIAIAVAALILERHVRARVPEPAVPARISAVDAPQDRRLALAIYAAAGGVALGYEVVWSELLVQFMSTRSYAFAVMLSMYLVGLSLGSYLFSRLRLRGRDPWRVLGALLAGAGLSAVAIVAMLGPWLPDAQTFAGMWAMRMTGRETLELTARFAVAAAVVLLVPTTLLGAAFPVASGLIAGHRQAQHGSGLRPSRGLRQAQDGASGRTEAQAQGERGRAGAAPRIGGDVGATLAVNTAGGIAGTLLTGFILVPWMGLVRALGCLTVAGATLGGIAIWKGGHGRLAMGAVVLTAAIAGLTPGDKLATLLADARDGTLVFYAEDTGGTVAVLQQQAMRSRFHRLYIQGVSNSGDALTSLRYMRLQALLPLLIHRGQPRSALVVGFGTGITAGALLADPGLQTRVVAELLPSVVRASSLFAGNLGAGTDSRLDIRIGDGRQELQRRSQRYDLITLEPPPPSAIGVVNLYSTDFYELCKARLQSDGLMGQWWPLPTQNDEDSQSLVRSFLDVFPYATAWSTELHEVLLVGSASPIELDGARVAARFGQPTIRAALEEVGIESPEALLATWLTDRNGLERFAGAALPVSDDRPLIEHAAWVRRGEFPRVVQRLLALTTDVPLPEADPLRPAIQSERSELFAFYRFSLHAMAGEHEQARTAFREVLAHDATNPYYLWFADRR